MSIAIDSVKRLAMVVLFVGTAISCSRNPEDAPDGFTANNLTITNTIVGSANTLGQYRMITFDIRWDHSWRTSGSPDNWDAAWVFCKYRVGNGEWKHATLSTVSAEHVSPSGSTITPPADGKGVFIYRSEDGTGAFSASGVSLRWNCGLDNVADDADVSVRVFGLEMVNIPEGSFYAGDNGYSSASFTKGSNDPRSWFIDSEDAIEVTDTAFGGYYYIASKDFWNDIWNAHEDATGTSFTIPADFPKGYRAIYCMKYEMTQQQYVDFLNTLNSTQSSSRYNSANFNRFGYSILENNGVYSTVHPKRACGFLCPADGFAYADWSGLRPMTELEFEKICRGSGNVPVSGEFAWGTTYRRNAVNVNGTESDRETITESGANSYYLEEGIFSPQFPLIAGIFVDEGKSREQNGAAFYGVLEMSGNLHETCISVGNQYGRAFTYRNGDGRLAADGCADESHWPLSDGVGSGFRGGCLAEEGNHMTISDRVFAASGEINAIHRHIPWGFRGVRTVDF